MRAFCMSRALRSDLREPREHVDKLSDRGEFDRASGRAADQSGRTGAEPVASATMRRTTSMSVVFSPRRFGLPVP